MISRRKMLASTAAVLAAASTRVAFGQTDPHAGHGETREELPPPTKPAQTGTRRMGGHPTVVTPNGTTLPWKKVGGVKVFHLVAEPVKREFAPGLMVNCWGYNGQTPGPTIEVQQGDHVRIYVSNRLPEPTSVHWHGLLLPNGMDGVSGLNQKPIEPGETFKYEFTLRQHGTHMYHPHFDEMVQMAMGMQGMFIIHPRDSNLRRVDRDFAIMLNEWFIKPGTATPDPTRMTDFNILTFNSKVFPATEPLIARYGDRVRIRIANLSSMDSHPIHLHGYQFKITGTDGGPVAPSAQQPETTVWVPVGSTRDIEFVADELGDWAMHCHITHHVMNQMGHELFPNLLGARTADVEAKLAEVAPGTMLMGQTGMGHMMEMGAPRNSIPMMGGVGPFSRIDMGGMFTVLKVRKGLTSYEDPGWFHHPKGTVAEPVTEDELRQAGFDVPPPPEGGARPHHGHGGSR
jgi:FtsP/CotA-like multicopper oxidase with cupredoxin domain